MWILYYWVTNIWFDCSSSIFFVSAKEAEIKEEKEQTLPIISLPKLIWEKKQAVKIEVKRKKPIETIFLQLYLEAGRLEVVPTTKKRYLFLIEEEKEVRKEITKELIGNKYKLFLPTGDYKVYLPVDITYQINIDNKVGETKINADKLKLDILKVDNKVGNVELKVKLSDGSKIIVELKIGNLEALILSEGCEYKLEASVKLGRLSFSGSGFNVVEWKNDKKIVKSAEFDNATNPAYAKLKVNLGNLKVDIGSVKGGTKL